MNPSKLLFIPLCLLASFLLSSCETTNSGYGYYLGEFNDDAIVQYFALNDEAVNQGDFEYYKSFLSPSYLSVDKSEFRNITLNRIDYLESIEDTFKNAKYLELSTRVMDINYSESGYQAIVKVHEEQKTNLYGDKVHTSSLFDVEIAFEDGWIFTNKATCTSKQILED